MVCREQVDYRFSPTKRYRLTRQVAEKNAEMLYMLTQHGSQGRESVIRPIITPEVLENRMGEEGASDDAAFEVAWEQRRQAIVEQGLESWSLQQVKKQRRATWDAKT